MFAASANENKGMEAMMSKLAIKAKLLNTKTHVKTELTPHQLLKKPTLKLKKIKTKMLTAKTQAETKVTPPQLAKEPRLQLHGAEALAEEVKFYKEVKLSARTDEVKLYKAVTKETEPKK